MEKRINAKIDKYVLSFKDDIRHKAEELGLTANAQVSQLLQFMYDYERLHITKEDLIKRKRCKNGVCQSERCVAKRSSGEQCTRRKKKGHNFCGTHTKGAPHGICEIVENQSQSSITRVEVRMEEINGIMYFIDNSNNVYQTEDVMLEKTNPTIIGKYINGADKKIQYI